MNYLKIFNKLNEFENLSEDWDGYGAKAPEKKIVDTARSIVSLFEIKQIPEPKPMVGSNNNIGFYWKNDKKYIEINIEEIGEYSYYIEFEDKKYNFKDGISENDLPEELEIMIKDLS